MSAKKTFKLYTGLVLTIIYATAYFTCPAPSLHHFLLTNTSKTKLQLMVPPKVTLEKSFRPEPYNHAASLLSFNKKLYITWYAGKSEHNPDVSIYLSIGQYKNNNLVFTKPMRIITRQQAQQAENRSIHTLGNPILFKQNHRIWLFFVSATSGWSTSSVNESYSDNGGVTWSSPKELITSAFSNFSTLLKGNAIRMEHHFFSLPAYNEFIDKSGLFITLSPQGDITQLTRMTWNGGNLQPFVIPLNKKHALAFYRRSSISPKTIFFNHTEDSGRHWSKATPTPLPNPDSAFFALRSQSKIIMLYNNQTTGRTNLSIAASNIADINKWKVLYTLPNPKHTGLAYPYLITFMNQPYFALSAGEGQQEIKLYRINLRKQQK